MFFYAWALFTLLMRVDVLVLVGIVAAYLVLRRLLAPGSLGTGWLQRNKAMGKLRQTLEVNPHHRDARHDLALLLLERKQFEEADQLLAENLRADPEDLETRFFGGVAALGTGKDDRVRAGVELLESVEAQKPTFRSGAVPLELGRGLLRVGELRVALAHLERAAKLRPGSVEARVLLADCHKGLGDAAAAQRAREEAWRLHREAAPFERRAHRLWAWRARPMAAVRTGLLFLVPVVAVASLALAYESELPSWLPSPVSHDSVVTSERLELAEAQFDADRLEDALGRIETWLEANDPQTAQALQPGLTDEEIDAITTGIPEEVRILYRWHNGVSGPTGHTAVLWYHRFVPLAAAVEARALIPGNWVVLFEFEGGESIFVERTASDARAAPLGYHFIEYGQPTLMHTNLTLAFAIWADALEAGVVTPDDMDSARLEEIGRGIDPWSG